MISILWPSLLTGVTTRVLQASFFINVVDNQASVSPKVRVKGCYLPVLNQQVFAIGILFSNDIDQIRID
jgi:hypothetical protein